jgi:hypothetical protein
LLQQQQETNKIYNQKKEFPKYIFKTETSTNRKEKVDCGRPVTK